MQALFLGLAVLACPVGMGVMMWMMMRGQNKTDTASASGQDGDARQQLGELRAEIDQLKAERVTQLRQSRH